MSDQNVSVPKQAPDRLEESNKLTESSDTVLVERVNQLYRAYLDTIYNFDLYSADRDRTITWSRRWDYIIGLSAAISGGSGLGILADPRLAWLCGIITTASIFLTVGKSTYDWPGKLKFDLDRVNDYTKLRFEWQYLKEDVEKNRKWSADLEKRFVELRKFINKSPKIFIRTSV